jgi:SAM-dependent methyltransferase
LQATRPTNGARGGYQLRIGPLAAEGVTYRCVMATDDTHRLGYHGVDADPNADVLLATMAQTARWDATLQLRSWERAQLRLSPGERLLDVGCGLAEAAMALAEDLGDTGEVVGIDVSETMLRVARLNAQATRCPMRFTVGDARSIDEPDKSFDAARSERTLQWLADPAAAVAELVRVVRPSGRISLIDTDWSTFTLDVGDEALAVLVHRALSTEQQRASNVGRRLQDLLRAAGCLVVARTHATQTWTTWDPDRSPAPPGCFSMESLADDLVAMGGLAPTGRSAFVSTIHDAARRGEFSMRLTMYGVLATTPM